MENLVELAGRSSQRALQARNLQADDHESKVLPSALAASHI